LTLGEGGEGGGDAIEIAPFRSGAVGEVVLLVADRGVLKHGIVISIIQNNVAVPVPLQCKQDRVTGDVVPFLVHITTHLGVRAVVVARMVDNTGDL